MIVRFLKFNLEKVYNICCMHLQLHLLPFSCNLLQALSHFPHD